MDGSLRFRVFQLLMDASEDISIREIARRLGCASSLAHYHVKQLHRLGLLVRRETGLNGRIVAYYAKQPIFTEDTDATLRHLRAVMAKIETTEPDKVALCIRYFLELSDGEGCSKQF